MNTIIETVSAYSNTGSEKTKLPIWKMLVLAVMSGVYIAFSGAAANSVIFAMQNPGLAKLVNGLIFPFGLGMIITTGSELFTGNCLISISVLDKKATLSGMVKNLFFVYIGNFIGAAGAAALCIYSGQAELGDGALALYMMKVASAKCSIGFWQAFGLAFCCNILVVTAIMMSLSARELPGRIIGAYLPVCVFVMCGFEHCIANMYYIPSGLFALTVPKYAALAADAGLDLSVLTLGGMLKNILPVTLGNIIGGCAVAVELFYCRLYDKSEANIG